MVACATNHMHVCWLIAANPYLKSSHLVYAHTNPACCFALIKPNKHKVNTNTWKTVYVMYDNVFISTTRTSNVHFCLNNKSKHSLNTPYSNHYLPLKNHNFFLITNYYLGPPIKWWEGIGNEDQRRNTSINSIKYFENVVAKLSSENDIYAIILRSMAEASSTKNMDVCIVDENKIINTSKKRTTSALLTITQKKAKNKTILRSRTSSSLWLGFHALNLLNKEKNLPMETEETTRELLKRKIDFDEAKEIQSVRPSFPYVPQKEWPSKREDGIKGQHYNLTQLPFDVEVDEDGFSFDYQVSIHFELADRK